ncbi:negative elongation factor D-like [Anneissia japonica]|uniref:negative elongation factor D-like n=1 Tax=Anneissia japonica TaxID=1529436 RepID=UPI0014258F3D|nr:negative elongation factor D-like [Anneissia japonica]
MDDQFEPYNTDESTYKPYGGGNYGEEAYGDGAYGDTSNFGDDPYDSHSAYDNGDQVQDKALYGFEDEPEEEGPYESEVEKDDETIRSECLSVFAATDYIMEPGVFENLRRYFQAGGTPEQVVLLLSEHYTAVAQTVNLFAEWLITTGVNPTEVQQMVEDHLKSLIIKHFDPKKADKIFSDEGGTPSWLEGMIQHRTWRQLFYKLAGEHPDCLMLNFTIKLITDLGYQGEIGNVSTACHQIEVFSKVLQTSIGKLLEGGEEALHIHLPEFGKMVCHGEHTYLYAQAMMHLLSSESGGSVIRRVCQEVQKSAMKSRGDGVVQIGVALSGAAKYPRACQALASMLARNALNPADVTVLYEMYNKEDPPPVDLLRMPQLLELFMHTLFRPKANINADHRPKYIYLLAHSACVHETWKKGKRINISKDELKQTSQAIDKIHMICSSDKPASELIADLTTIYQCIRYPVVSMGILYWVDKTISEPSYFERMTDHTPLHLILLDEIINMHNLIHDIALKLLIRLLEDHYPQLDVLVQVLF